MKNILDLCRLNSMEENIKDSPAVDRDATLAAVDWSRRQLVVKIAAQTEAASDEVMERHLKRQREHEEIRLEPVRIVWKEKEWTIFQR